ncbi:MAG TPA: vanadium-dependent haloperoxidase [Vicinamibacterales bacterium]|nr:vanadium-dependent haloperoxidase [Vicinamibacterales bacterium]
MTRKLLAPFLGALVACLAIAGPVRADEVTDWNQTLFRSAVIAATSPLNTTRVAALVQAAVFDAINGIDRRYTPIHVPPNAPPGASRRAAAVAAAYVMLSKNYGTGGLLTQTQQGILNARRDAALIVIAADESPGAITDGVNWGTQVANLIWDWRSGDGFSLAAPTFPGSPLVGQWRPTPNAPATGTSTLGVGYPQFFNPSPMFTWSGISLSQVDPGPPPALGSARYLQDYNETKSMGSQNSPLRTPDQTIGALFWNSSTAGYIWNRLAVSLIQARDRDREEEGRGHRYNTLLENARLLAALNVAVADAAYGCWTAKYTYTYWRPITAIREDDGNPATAQDPSWSPLFATPGHPEYPSGHSCLSGAAAAIIGSEFGTHIPITVTSDTMIGVSRRFHGFTEALEDVKNARIFSGIHFRTATEAGTSLGADVATYVIENMFQKVN